MDISAKSIKFDEFNMWVELNDTRTLGVPLAGFFKLMNNSPNERNNFELNRLGIH